MKHYLRNYGDGIRFVPVDPLGCRKFRIGLLEVDIDVRK